MKIMPSAAATETMARNQKTPDSPGWWAPAAIPGTMPPSSEERPGRRADRSAPSFGALLVFLGAEEVVVLFRLAEAHLVRWELHALGQRREQHLLGVDEVLAAVVGQLVLVGHCECSGRVRLDAQAAQDAAQVVDLVGPAVALTRGEPRLLGVVGALHVDRVRGAGPRAQLAAHALLQPVGPAVELVTAVETRRGWLLDLRILDRLGLHEHLVEGDTEPLDRVQEIKHGWPPWGCVERGGGEGGGGGGG